MPVSTLGEMLKLAVESRDVISLGPGEPDFDSDKRIIKSAKKWLDKGETHYSPPSGRAELKEQIIRKLRKDNKINVSPDEIIVTAGSTEAILLGLMCLVDPGEGVVVTDPGFLAYKPTIEILNGMPISVPLKEEEGWQPNVERMKELLVPEKTRAMIINTPTNPTGTVYTKKTLEELADFAVENDLVVVSDEAYEKLVYGGAKHVSIASLNGMEERTLTLQSVSKTYAMAGFRVGWAAGPEEIIQAMTKLKLFTSISPCTASQLAAADALRGPQDMIEGMRKEYNRRRKFIVKRLNEIGLSTPEPNGAFYAFSDIRHSGKKSLDFCKWLLKTARVACIPGTEFGCHGEGYVRFSYATKYELIEKALERVERALQSVL